MKLSLYYFRHNKNLACYTLTKSRIPFYDLTIVLDGTLNYTLNGKKYAVTKNQVLFLPPNTIRYREKGNAPSNYVIVTNNDIKIIFLFFITKFPLCFFIYFS